MHNKTAITALNRKDHYLPRTYLRFFIDPTEKLLRTHDKTTGEERLIGPGGICYERGFDDLKPKKLSNCSNAKVLSDYWNKIEPNKKRTEAENTWRDNILAIEKEEFAQVNKRSMSLLIALMMQHTPYDANFMHAQIKGESIKPPLYRQLPDELLEEHGFNKDTRLAIHREAQCLNQTKEETKVINYLSACAILAPLLLCDVWTFLYCQSDNPKLQLVTANTPSSLVFWHIAKQIEICIYIPLTPKLGLLMKINKRSHDKIFPTMCSNLEILNEFARKLAPKIDNAYSKNKLVRLTEQKDVDYLNMMVCFTAEKFVILPAAKKNFTALFTNVNKLILNKCLTTAASLMKIYGANQQQRQ